MLFSENQIVVNVQQTWYEISRWLLLQRVPSRSTYSSVKFNNKKRWRSYKKRRKLKKKTIINFCCRFGEEHFKKKLLRSLSTQTMVQKEKARTSHTNTSINSKINCLMWWLPCWWSNLQEWNFKDKPYESMNLEIQCTYLHFDLFPRFYCYLTF